MKTMMRTLCAAATAVLAILATVPAAKGDSEVIDGARWYYIVEDGAATLTSVYDATGDVVVPATLGGCPVTAIGDYAFAGSAQVTNLAFPDSLRKIGNGNFRRCSALATVTFNAALESVGVQTFGEDTRVSRFVVPAENANFSAEGGVLYNKDGTVLIVYSEAGTEFDVPTGVKAIGERAFSYRNLVRVSLPEGLEEIREYAFFYNPALAAVSIPSTVGKVGDSAFADCRALAKLEIGDGVGEIGACAFDACAALEAVAIPDSVKAIGGRAFEFCGKLADVTIGSGVARLGKTEWSIESNEWGYVEFYNAEAAFGGCDSLLDFKLAEGNATFEEIGGALYYRATPDTAKALAAYPSGRSELYFPSSITVAEIGPAACAQCNKFTKVAIPASVREIGAGSFTQCEGLGKVTVPEGPANIAAGAFALNMFLEDVEIAGSVKTIGPFAFMHDYMGEEGTVGRLVMHEGIESIGEGAFEMNRDLREIVIPDSVTALGRSAFASSMGVTRAVVGAGVTALPDELFYSCSAIGELTLRGTVDRVGVRALHLCESLPYVSLPDVETIGKGALYRCEKMTRVELGDSLRTIGEEAFDYCIGLRDVIVPAGTVEIGDRAFRQCTNLVTACLPVRFEGVLDTGSVFEGCSPDIIYYGDAGPATVTVTFVSGGEAVGRMDYLPGILDYLPEAVPPAPGLAFTGWFTEPEGGHLATGADLTGDTTLYAQFAESPFTDAGKWKPAEDPDAPGTTVWRSAEIGRGHSAEATLAVAGPGVLTFSWKFNGDRYDDELSVLVDSEEAAHGTNAAWEAATVEVSGAGSHTVVWRFRRTSWSSQDDACGWLKDIAFAPAGGGGGGVEAEIGGSPVPLERGEDGRTYQATVAAGTDPADVVIKLDGADVSKGFRRSVEGTTFTAVLLDPYDVPKEEGAPGGLWADNGNGTVTLNVAVVPGLYYSAASVDAISAFKRPAGPAPSAGSPIVLDKPGGSTGFFGVWVATEPIPAEE